MTPQSLAPNDVPFFNQDVVQTIESGSHHDPHSVLGVHPAATAQGHSSWTIRALRPLAQTVTILTADGHTHSLTHRGHSVWEGVSSSRPRLPYIVDATYSDGSHWRVVDPYQFAPTISNSDLHAIDNGTHEELWKVLGSHYTTAHESVGTAFTVWAPHARAVRVVGDFNGWNGTLHAMRSMGSSGVWDLFIPDTQPGMLYKYEILTGSGSWVLKIDPMARLSQTPPDTASITTTSSYEWRDQAWVHNRTNTDPHRGRLSIYELHLGSWRKGLSYRTIADPLIDYVSALGFTHVEFMPLAEHPFGGSWGYQVTGYYSPTSRYGTPDDLRYLIDRLHGAGIGVIMDWVPGHFPKDDWGLARFDGEPLYEHADPHRGEHPDWGTYIFDYGNPRVRNFLVSNALYWLEEFHVDGLRVDAVASMLYLDYSRGPGEWEPNVYGGNDNLEARAFLVELTSLAYRRNPGTVIIAEESTSYPGITTMTSQGGLGFGFKWNMGWMHDTVHYMQEDPLWRGQHHNLLTLPFSYAWSENYILPISHDEVVHGKGSLLAKMPGNSDQKVANVRVFLAAMWTQPGKQLLFMGQEFGQSTEWNETLGVEWGVLERPAHHGIWLLVQELNRIQKNYPALWSLDNDPAGFEWLDGADSSNNVISFLRKGDKRDSVAVILNFSGLTHTGYRIGLPHSGRWQEVLNTDALAFGGSGQGNSGSVTANGEPWVGQRASALLTLPALSAIVLAYQCHDT